MTAVHASTESDGCEYAGAQNAASRKASTHLVLGTTTPLNDSDQGRGAVCRVPAAQRCTWYDD
jgi:hypothetical protein